MKPLTQQQIAQLFDAAGAIITGDHFVYAKKADGWYHGDCYVNKDALYPNSEIIGRLCYNIYDHFLLQSIEVVIGPTVGGVSLSQWVAHWFNEHLKIFTGLRSEGKEIMIADEKPVFSVYADEEDILEDREIQIVDPGQINLANVVGNINLNLDLARSGVYFDRLKLVYKEKVGTRRILKRGYDKIVAGKKCLVVEDIINSGATVKKTVEAIKLAGGEVVGVGDLCNRSGGKVTAQTLGVPELYSLLDLEMKMEREENCSICQAKGVQSVRTDIGKGKEFLARIGK